jgi:hypothetical protein
MHEHFHLVDGVSEVEASSVFNNATWKMIKDTGAEAADEIIVVLYV